MSLKGFRSILDDEISLSCDVVADPGKTLVYQTTAYGSGIALGDRAGKATWVANPSGYKPAGVLVTNVVNVDLTRYHKNFHKDEVNINEPVRLVTKGKVMLDNIIGSPNPGDTAYLSSSGTVTPTLHATGGLVATPKIGRFNSKKDENGYAVLEINLPA